MNIKSMNNEELKVISSVLDEAIEFGLEVETIYWALIAMKQNPEMTPAEAMALGILEWVK